MNKMRTLMLVGLMLAAGLTLTPNVAASHECAHVNPNNLDVVVHAGNCAATIVGAALPVVAAALVFVDRMCQVALHMSCQII